MTRVVVEHPIEEAQALLKRLGVDPMTVEEVDLARAGKERLERAVEADRTPSVSGEGRYQDRAWALEDAILEFKGGYIDRDRLFEVQEKEAPKIGDAS